MTQTIQRDSLRGFDKINTHPLHLSVEEKEAVVKCRKYSRDNFWMYSPKLRNRLELFLI